jgi:hypothetical protein
VNFACLLATLVAVASAAVKIMLDGSSRMG